MSLKRVSPEDMVGNCSWCGRSIPAGFPMFAIAGKKREGMDFSEQAGKWIQVALDAERRLPALVPAANSQAAQQGFDLMFIACTRECGNATALALETAIQQGGTVLEGVKPLGGPKPA